MSIIRFIRFINENYLFEARENEINRFMKLHKDHDVQNAGDELNNWSDWNKWMRGAMEFSIDHGQNHAERMIVAKWVLDDHVRHEDNEDSPMVKNIMKRYRSAKAKGKVDPEHNIGWYHTPEHATEHLDEVHPIESKKHMGGSEKERKILDEFSEHKLGTIETDSHGPLDVYNFHNKTHGKDRVKQAQREFIKPSCGENATWCVASNDQFMTQYSKGHGFMLYTKEGTTHPVLGHGYSDRGIVDSQNSLIENHDEVAEKTHELLPKRSEQQVHHQFTFPGGYKGDWKGVLNNPKFNAAWTDGEERSMRIMIDHHHDEPEVVRKIMGHPKAGEVSSAFLTRIAVHHGDDPEMARKIIDHPNVDDFTLSMVVPPINRDDPEIAKKIRDHPKAGEYVFKKLEKQNSLRREI